MGGLGSYLKLEEGERMIGGVMLSFSEWVVPSREGWELVLEFGQILSCSGLWLP